MEIDWPKVKEIFSAALEKDVAARPDYLDQACGADLLLREEVQSLLDHHEDASEFIEEPAFNTGAIFAAELNPGPRSFGPYHIVRELGAGGMGAVFLAERSDGQFEQQVAIKVVRQVLADRELVERFKRERQILASLNHPNIAKLVDGGVAEDGSPFLAMEYVEGVTVTKFVEEHRPDLEEILRLFLKICAAVSYAHRHLVVHRDLKPNNILVDAEGEPKLLDFGLAKLIDGELSDPSDRTQTAFRALTPAYASPEQINGEALTTVSDIYSLGVVFYELLSNERPYQCEGKKLQEILTTIQTSEPLRPSEAAARSARRPGAKNLNLKGDLDNIALMALRRERERRYQSVEQFAEDIERYLAGLPVSARPNTYRYRTQKFVRRNRWAVAALALIFLTLVAGIVVSRWQARQARREQAKVEMVNDFLEQMLRYSNPFNTREGKGRNETTVNEIVDEAARRLDSGEFDSQPEVRAELERTIGRTYMNKGQFELARKHLGVFIAISRQLYGDQHPKTADGLAMWAALLFSMGEMTEAERTYRNVLPLLRTEEQKGNIPVGLLAETLNNLAYLRRTQGDSREAEALFRETLTLMPRVSPESLRLIATTRSTLASTLYDQGRFEEAFQTAREAVEEFRGRGELDTGSYGFALTIWGGFLTEKGLYAEADQALLEAEQIFRRYPAPVTLWLGDNLRNQAGSLYGQAKYAKAIVKADEALKIYETNFGKHYDQYPTTLIVKGLSLSQQGRLPEGEAVLRESVALRMGALPAEHYWVALARSALGENLILQKRLDEAAPLLRESYQSLQSSQGEASPRTQLARQRLDRLTTAQRGTVAVVHS